MTEKSAARMLVDSSVIPRRRDTQKKPYVVSLPPITPTIPNGFSTYLWWSRRRAETAKSPGPQLALFPNVF
jgi:hypothetical protein